jgi:hypothetical protein
MAEVMQNDLYSILVQIAESRKEAVDHTNEIVREGLRTENNVRRDVTDSAYKNLLATDNVGDRLIDQLDKQYHRVEGRDYAVMRDLAEMKGSIGANQTAILAEMRMGSERSARDSEIYSLKAQIEAQKNTQAILEKVGADGTETRRLINELKVDDLNRMLIERNSEIVEERFGRHHWRGNWDQSQFAHLNSQLQAFQSQLQETRQGMVNFGTMAGVGQTSTSNNVR